MLAFMKSQMEDEADMAYFIEGLWARGNILYFFKATTFLESRGHCIDWQNENSSKISLIAFTQKGGGDFINCLKKERETKGWSKMVQKDSSYK